MYYFPLGGNNSPDPKGLLVSGGIFPTSMLHIGFGRDGTMEIVNYEQGTTERQNALKKYPSFAQEQKDSNAVPVTSGEKEP